MNLVILFLIIVVNGHEGEESAIRIKHDMEFSFKKYNNSHVLFLAEVPHN